MKLCHMPSKNRINCFYTGTSEIITAFCSNKMIHRIDEFFPKVNLLDQNKKKFIRNAMNNVRNNLFIEIIDTYDNIKKY